MLFPVTTRNINLSVMSLVCSRTKGGTDRSSVDLSAVTYLTCQVPSICVKTGMTEWDVFDEKTEPHDEFWSLSTFAVTGYR